MLHASPVERTEPRVAGEPVRPRARVAARRTLLVTLNGGGWHRQTVTLLRALSPDEFRFVYVGGAGVDSRRNTIAAPHPGHRITLPSVGQTSRRPWRHLTNSLRLVRVFAKSVGIIRRLRPAGILAVGTPNAVPLFIIGRLFGVRCVFVESLTRMRSLSRTGRLLYHLRLADRLYVQWPRLGARYPRVVYAGAVI